MNVVKAVAVYVKDQAVAHPQFVAGLAVGVAVTVAVLHYI